MPRSYRQNCALAHSLDLLGERWTLLIVRELMLGPRRYRDLLENLEGIGTNLLATRLRDLQHRGLVDKDDQHYRLTTAGHHLEPIVFELIRFGLSLGIEDDDDRLTRPEWDAVALRALYRPEKAQELRGRFVVDLDGHPLCVEKIGRDVRVIPGPCAQADAAVHLSKHAARRLAGGELDLGDALDDGSVQITGSRRVARQLLRSFSLLP